MWSIINLSNYKKSILQMSDRSSDFHIRQTFTQSDYILRSQAEIDDCLGHLTKLLDEFFSISRQLENAKDNLEKKRVMIALERCGWAIRTQRRTISHINEKIKINQQKLNYHLGEFLKVPNGPEPEPVANGPKPEPVANGPKPEPEPVLLHKEKYEEDQLLLKKEKLRAKERREQEQREKEEKEKEEYLEEYLEY